MPSENQVVFDDIYKSRKWIFGSGTGSIAFLNKSFLRFINNLLQTNPDIRSVLDIGCGDWQMGKHYALEDKRYIGIDVSPQILNQTKSKYSASNREFYVLDAIKQPLPDADLVIVKDVFQHLCNQDIVKVVKKLNQYRWVVVQTDIEYQQTNLKDIPNGSFRPVDLRLPLFERFNYQLALTYTESARQPSNLFLKWTHQQIIQKGIFVHQKS